MLLWIGQAFSTPEFLRSRLILGVVTGVAAVGFFTWILFQMERHNATYQARMMLLQSISGGDTQLELEEETETDDSAGGSNNSRDDDEAVVKEHKSPQRHQHQHHQGDYVQAGDGGEEDEHDNYGKKYEPDGLYKHKQQQQQGSVRGNHSDDEDKCRSLSRAQQCTIVAHVAVLMLLNYLLLVFLPGNALLSFLAVTAIWVLTLQNHLRDELRRGRWDRLWTLVALFFVIAGCFTLITYCRLALQVGSIYQGPARIVGYDAGVYDNSDAETLRTDLSVTWGGAWGCPDNHDKQCTGTVSGALCETEYDVQDWTVNGEEDDQIDDDYVNNNGNRRRREEDAATPSPSPAAEEDITEDAAVQEEIAEEEAADEEAYEEELDEEYVEDLEEDEEYVEEEAEVEVEEYEDELDEYYAYDEEDVDEVYEEAEDEEYENEELEEEKDELEEENEELEEDLEDEEEYADELEDEIEDGGYEDDAFEDDYWEYDWDSVWGDYACEDLFDSDLQGQSYDANEAPGKDEWPTIEIYGSCNSCEAYIMDYFSTDHFLGIRLYEVQSVIYLWLGFVLLIVAAVAALKERIRPAQEKEVVLLTHEGGVPA